MEPLLFSKNWQLYFSLVYLFWAFLQRNLLTSKTKTRHPKHLHQTRIFQQPFTPKPFCSDHYIPYITCFFPQPEKPKSRVPSFLEKLATLLFSGFILLDPSTAKLTHFITQNTSSQALPPYKNIPAAFYTKAFLHPSSPDTFYTRHRLCQAHLHQKPFRPDTFYTRHILHEAPFAPDTSYTNRLLHQTTFTPGTFYTNQLSHQVPFTPTNFYTTQLSHQTIFTPTKLLHQTTFTPTSFYTRHLLHQPAFTPDTFYTKHLLHQTPFTPDTFYTRQLSHQTPFTPTDFYTRRVGNSTFHWFTSSGPLYSKTPATTSHT